MLLYYYIILFFSYLFLFHSVLGVEGQWMAIQFLPCFLPRNSFFNNTLTSNQFHSLNTLRPDLSILFILFSISLDTFFVTSLRCVTNLNAASLACLSSVESPPVYSQMEMRSFTAGFQSNQDICMSLLDLLMSSRIADCIKVCICFLVNVMVQVMASVLVILRTKFHFFLFSITTKLQFITDKLQSFLFVFENKK